MPIVDSGLSQKNKYDFKFSRNARTYQYNACVVSTFGDFVPNADWGQIEHTFWSLKEMEEDEGGEAQKMLVSSSSLRMSYPILVQLLTGLELVLVL